MNNLIKLERKVESEKQKLILLAEQNGIYENFGQKEVRLLKDKFIDISSYSKEMNFMRDVIDNFNNWCMNYTG
jgi:hypothetical protein